MNDADQPGLPGLDNAPPSSGVRSPLEQAVRDTIEQLRDLGFVESRHAVHIALATALAQSITSKLRSGRTSTLSNDARELRELLDGLVPDDAETGMDERLEQAMEAWQAAIDGGVG